MLCQGQIIHPILLSGNIRKFICCIIIGKLKPNKVPGDELAFSLEEISIPSSMLASHKEPQPCRSTKDMLR